MTMIKMIILTTLDANADHVHNHDDSGGDAEICVVSSSLQWASSEHAIPCICSFCWSVAGIFISISSIRICISSVCICHCILHSMECHPLYMLSLLVSCWYLFCICIFRICICHRILLSMDCQSVYLLSLLVGLIVLQRQFQEKIRMLGKVFHLENTDTFPQARSLIHMAGSPSSSSLSSASSSSTSSSPSTPSGSWSSRLSTFSLSIACRMYNFGTNRE